MTPNNENIKLELTPEEAWMISEIRKAPSGQFIVHKDKRGFINRVDAHVPSFFKESYPQT